MITGSEACRTLATAFRLSVLLRASLGYDAYRASADYSFSSF